MAGAGALELVGTDPATALPASRGSGGTDAVATAGAEEPNIVDTLAPYRGSTTKTAIAAAARPESSTHGQLFRRGSVE